MKSPFLGKIGLGQRREGLGLRPGPLGHPDPPRSDLDRDAHDRRYGDEHDQRQDLIGVSDGERVERRNEEVVDQERGGNGRSDADQDTSDQGDPDDHQQVDEDLAVKREKALGLAQQERQQRQADEGNSEPGQLAAPRQPQACGAPDRDRLVEQVLASQVGDLGLAHSDSPITHGTLVTVTEGSNRSRPFSRSAVWL